MDKNLYILLGSLIDSLEWCYEQLEYISYEDSKVIEDVLKQANKQIEKGY